MKTTSHALKVQTAKNQKEMPYMKQTSFVMALDVTCGGNTINLRTYQDINF